MVDHTSGNEGFPFVIESNPPGITGPLAKDLKFPSPRMNAEQGASQWPAGMIFLIIRIGFGILHVRVIKDSVQSIQPSIGTPGERVG